MRDITELNDELEMDLDERCEYLSDCDGSDCECVCEKCAFPDEEGALGTMSSEELVDYAYDTFNVVLNKYKSERTLVKEIMDLYEFAEEKEMVRDCNRKKIEVPKYAKNSK